MADEQAISELAAELAELRQRLAVVEDEQAILKLLHRFTHHIDSGMEAEFVDLFTDDGVFEVRRRTGEVARRSGREEMARFIAGHTRAPQYFHQHLLFSPVIAVDGDMAHVESYFALLDEHRGGPFVKTFGRYWDTLARSHPGPEGWRIRERRAEVQVRTPDYTFAGEALRLRAEAIG